jgi:copper chaperone CopZ
MNEQKITIKGMTCGHCEGRVIAELLKISGVTGVVASSEKANATITSVVPIDEQSIELAVRQAGYSVVP